VVETGSLQIPDYRVPAEAIEAERARLDQAAALARRQVRRLKAKADALPASVAEEVGVLLEAHAAMLNRSRLLREADRLIVEQRMNAEAAVHHASTQLETAFRGMGDAYLAARAEDVREATRRVLRSLRNLSAPVLDDPEADGPFVPADPAVAGDEVLETHGEGLPAGTILIAEEFTPADAALMDPARIAGFAAMAGGTEGHTAIMARARGLPAVLGATGLAIGGKHPMVATGDAVVIDGLSGRVIIHPSPETLAAAEVRRAELARRSRKLAALRDKPAVTLDGASIRLLANLELPEEVNPALEAGAEGIGLLRTEFQFMNRDDVPDEHEQAEALSAIVAGMGGRPVTLRTLDIGGDKLAPAFGVPEGANPALGLRAIRLGLRRRDILEPQLAAMLRAGVFGPVRILLPMVSRPQEVRDVRAAMLRVARRLRRRKVPIADPLPPLGAMIEVPGAALAADALAEVCDFFAIGTNDLTQYTLAIDRGDDQVATLYDPEHPAVLRLIQFTASAAQRAAIPVSICGEMAGDPRFTTLLIGLGVRDLSMAPAAIPEVKARVRELELRAAARLAQAVMRENDPARIAELLE